MAEADGSSGWGVEQSTDPESLRDVTNRYVDAARLRVYKTLLKRLGTNVRLELRDGEIFFVYDDAYVLTIGPELEKGIMYSSDGDANRIGTPIENLNQLRALPTSASGLYVRRLDQKWDIYFQIL